MGYKKTLSTACPACNGALNSVMDSRLLGATKRRRRRKCDLCGHKWTTVEMPRAEYDEILRADKELKKLKAFLGRLDWKEDTTTETESGGG